MVEAGLTKRNRIKSELMEMYQIAPKLYHLKVCKGLAWNHRGYSYLTIVFLPKKGSVEFLSHFEKKLFWS